MRLLLFLLPLLLFADGGKLVLRQTAGPLTISLFSSPETPRVGPLDLSVVVQKSQDQLIVSDAQIKIRLMRSTSAGIDEVYAPAKGGKATMQVPSAGDWKVEVDVATKLGNAQVAGNLHVLPPASPAERYWPYFLVVPLIGLLAAINIRLRRARARRRS